MFQKATFHTYQILLMKMKNKLCIILLFTFIVSDQKPEKTYYGNWPVNIEKPENLPDSNINCPGETGCSCESDKDCINNNCTTMPKGKYCTPKNGEIFPDFIAIDQFGDNVSIYDFSGHNKYILIEIGASWCTPCHEIAEWLTYDDKKVLKRKWFKDEYKLIRELIQNDEIYYIKVIFEDRNRNNATYDTLYDWYQKYPDDKIPILADSERFLHTWVKPTGLPTTILLNDKMEIEVFSTRGINAAFNKVTEIHSNE